MSMEASRLKPPISFIKNSELGGCLLSMVSSFPNHNTPTLPSTTTTVRASPPSEILINSGLSCIKMPLQLPNLDLIQGLGILANKMVPASFSGRLQLCSSYIKAPNFPAKESTAAWSFHKKKQDALKSPKVRDIKYLYKDGAPICTQNNGDSLFRAQGKDKGLGERSWRGFRDSAQQSLGRSHRQKALGKLERRDKKDIQAAAEEQLQEASWRGRFLKASLRRLNLIQWYLEASRDGNVLSAASLRYYTPWVLAINDGNGTSRFALTFLAKTLCKETPKNTDNHYQNLL